MDRRHHMTDEQKVRQREGFARHNARRGAHSCAVAVDLGRLVRRVYRQGYVAALNAVKRQREADERARYHDAMPCASGQDLREMSHAYTRA